MPWPHAFLLMLHGASPILASIGIRAIGMRLLGDRKLATVIALVYAFNPGILWPTISLVYAAASAIREWSAAALLPH